MASLLPPDAASLTSSPPHCEAAPHLALIINHPPAYLFNVVDVPFGVRYAVNHRKWHFAEFPAIV